MGNIIKAETLKQLNEKVGVPDGTITMYDWLVLKFMDDLGKLGKDFDIGEFSESANKLSELELIQDIDFGG